MATIYFDTSDIESYRKFLRVKSLPCYKINGRTGTYPDEYEHLVTGASVKCAGVDYRPLPGLFDYQRDLAAIAIRKRKYAIFADCGLGKTLVYFEFARTFLENNPGKGVLIFTPAMVGGQIVDECRRFYGDAIPCERVPSSDIGEWLRSCGGSMGVCNYEALREVPARGELGCLILDESSILKSFDGTYGNACVELGRGLDWKLCGTGTPAPNDRIEYALHSVFLDQFPTTNAFLARFFINRGQTGERWELKKHCLAAFYRAMSHWSIFLTNPATYGWRDNCDSIPPVLVHIHDVDMTAAQHAAVRKETGELFATSAGGIAKRHRLSKIAKGLDGSDSEKYEFIRDLIGTWPDESSIVWCWFNEEQDRLEEVLPDAGSIRGATKMPERERIIADFKAGRIRTLISKPDVLGFGLNLQVATRQVFSSLIDSYEQYYQAVKRSNRYGSTRPLNVHIPIMDIERSMAENVLRKAANVQRDTEEQEQIFLHYGYGGMR